MGTLTTQVLKTVAKKPPFSCHSLRGDDTIMKVQFAYASRALIRAEPRIRKIVSCVVDGIILSITANYAVMPNTLFLFIFGHERRKLTVIRMFFKTHRPQIGCCAFCCGIADMVGIVLIAGSAVHHILPAIHL